MATEARQGSGGQNAIEQPCGASMGSEECTYTVEIERGPDGLGIKLGTRKEDGQIVVLSFPKSKDGRIGPAESEGKIQVWDVIKSIGNMNVEGLDLKEVSSLLKGKKVVVMTLARPTPNKSSPRRPSFKSDIFSAFGVGAGNVLSKMLGTNTATPPGNSGKSAATVSAGNVYDMESFQLFCEKCIQSSMVVIRYLGVSLTPKVYKELSFEWYRSGRNNTFERIPGVASFYYQPSAVDVKHQICVKCSRKLPGTNGTPTTTFNNITIDGWHTSDWDHEGAKTESVWLKTNGQLSLDPSLEEQTKGFKEEKFAQFQAVVYRNQKYILTYDLRDCMALSASLLPVIGTRPAIKIQYPSDFEKYCVYFDPVDTSLMKLKFYNSMDDEDDEGEHNGKEFIFRVESSVSRDAIALALKTLGGLIRPIAYDEIIFESKTIDEQANFLNTNQEASTEDIVKDQNVDNVRKNLRTNLELLKQVTERLQHERNARSRFEMELSISRKCNEEIHLELAKKRQEMLEHHDRIEAMQASFDIAEASKQGLMIEVEKLTSKLCSDGNGSVQRNLAIGNASHMPLSEPANANTVSIHVPSTGAPPIEYSQTATGSITHSTGLGQADRIAKLMKDFALTREELQTELSRKEESEFMIKKLKQQMQEEKFQASAAGSRHARKLGELASMNNLQQREIKKLNDLLEAAKANFETTVEGMSAEIEQAKREKAEASAELEVEKRKQLSLIGDLSDYKTQFIELAETIKEMEQRATEHIKERDEAVTKNDKLTTERNALKRKISTLKKDLQRIAHVDALVAEKQELLLELSMQKAIALERGDNLKIFQNACMELDSQHRLPPHLKFLLTFCNDDDCML